MKDTMANFDQLVEFESKTVVMSKNEIDVNMMEIDRSKANKSSHTNKTILFIFLLNYASNLII